MESKELTVHGLFEVSRQYRVPYYQRQYVWTQENQWSLLSDDILAQAEARLARERSAPHFLGALILAPIEDGLRVVPVWDIIDGQQRLTTLQYALASLYLVLRARGQERPALQVHHHLRNAVSDLMDDEAVDVFKLWPTRHDQAAFIAAMNVETIAGLQEVFPDHYTQAGKLRKGHHPAPLAALHYFIDGFGTWIDKEPANTPARSLALMRALLEGCMVMAITLGKDDDAQVIFETLNARGVELHACDLIRNYIFMCAEKARGAAEDLYEEQWSDFDGSYWTQDWPHGRLKRPRLEWMIHAFLQAELKETVDLGRLYHEYRRYTQSSGEVMPAEAQLQTMKVYAEPYRRLEDGDETSPIGRFGARINPFDMTTVYPLALVIALARISPAAQDEMFSVLASYVARRYICDLTAKNYNNVFLSVQRQLQEGGVNPANLRTILSASKAVNSRWPEDGEFERACLTGALYPGCLDAPKMRAVLTELEAQLRRDARVEEVGRPKILEPDIDHMMPKSWYEYWPLSDGTHGTEHEAEIVDRKVANGEELNDHEKLVAKRISLVATLGNLTLLHLGVNREAQNFAFTTKHELFLQNTALRINMPLVRASNWDEMAIEARAKSLAQAALKAWPGPPVPG